MTKEQKKAALLDQFVRNAMCNKYNLITMCQGLFVEYDAIESEPPASKDLTIDEVFGGHCGTRIMRKASEHLNKPIKDIKLSEMPPLSWYRDQPGINKKSLWEYTETMKEQGFNDKLD